MQTASRCCSFLLILVVAGSLLSGPGANVAWAEAGWQAGVAKVVITPEKPMWLSGYASRTHPADGTLHDLWAKAIAFKSPEGKQSVLISLDLVGISRDLASEITELLQKKFQLQRADVVLCTSHTHCGPVMLGTLETMYFLDEEQQQRVEDYTRAFPAKIVQVVGAALEQLQPVTMSYAVGEAGFAVNRRENPEAEVPQRREAGELKGPVDHALPVLKVTNQQQQVVALVFGYACHATTLSFNQWNGDWPGFAQIALEEAYPNATALFVAGCGADQNPLPRRQVELAKNYGQQIATAIQKIEPQQWTPVSGTLQTEYREIAVPFSQLPTREELQQELASANRYQANRAKQLLQTLDKTGTLSATYPYPVQVWQIGNVPIVFLGGEVVVDYALQLKGDLHDPRLWVAGYCNDVMAYIPSRRVLLEGGYEGATSMVYYGLPSAWGPQIELLILSAAKKLLPAAPEK